MIMKFYCSGCKQTIQRDVSRKDNQPNIRKNTDGRIIGYLSMCDKVRTTVMCEPVEPKSALSQDKKEETK
jgi:hypothetical protein